MKFRNKERSEKSKKGISENMIERKDEIKKEEKQQDRRN